jgi:glutamate-5-semialdehyde dehydrogenase
MVMSPTIAHDIAKAARAAFEESSRLTALERVNALHEMQKELEVNKPEILDANKKDLEVWA